MTIWTPTLAQGRPISRGLAEAIAAAVQSGELSPGDRLPPHRELADLLGVSVGAVTRGYGEAARRGFVRGEVGRGTVVQGPDQGGMPRWTHSGGGPEVVDLGLVTGLYGLDPDLGAALADLAGRADIQELLRYQPSRGMRRHREAGSAWLSRFGLRADPGRVLVASGGQHALVVLLSSLFRPGDRIAASRLNYPGLMSLASMLGLRLVPLTSDTEGILPESLADACSREPLRGLYFMPGMHNPTTAGAGPARVAALAEVARRHGLLVVEDAAYALSAEEPLPTVAAHAPERTFFVASVSKMLAGGLRVAYVASPSDFLERLALGVTSTTWMASPLCVEIAGNWILDGTADAVLARKRAEARRRNDLARTVLEGLSFRSRVQGYYLWLKLPEPWRGMDFEQAAGARGVQVIAGESFAVGQTPAPMAVRVSLSGARTREELKHGLEVLAGLLAGPPRPGRAIV